MRPVMHSQCLRRSLHHLRRFCSKPAPPGNGPNHRSVVALDSDTIRAYVQPNAFVAPSASVIGSVVINDKSAIMYGAVVRGDLALIQIGALTIIGENSVLTAGSVDNSLSPSQAVATGLPVEPELLVGDYCNIGANVTLRGCLLEGYNTIAHCTSIGEGAEIGLYSSLEPSSTVAEGVQIPEAEVWGGSPARKIRDVTDENKIAIQKEAEAAFAITSAHAYEFLPVGFAYLEKESLEKQNSVAVTN